MPLLCCLKHVLHTEAWHGTKQWRFWPHYPGHLSRVVFSLREWQFCVPLARLRVTSLLENQLQSRAKEQSRRAIAAATASKTERGVKDVDISECLNQNLISVSHVRVKPQRVNILKGRKWGPEERGPCLKTHSWQKPPHRLVLNLTSLSLHSRATPGT